MRQFERSDIQSACASCPRAPCSAVAGSKTWSDAAAWARARQLDLDRVVALKLIAPELIEEPAARERFLREAHAAVAVDHANVLPVHGAGIEDGHAYLVRRYVQGHDLRDVVRTEGALEPRRAAEFTLALGRALDAIHRTGYVHRDVKPANVLIDEDGHVYLSDFGLAKHALTSGGLTAADRWVGHAGLRRAGTDPG